MKKQLLLLSVLFLLCAKNLAVSKDSISTLYTNGEFKTYCVLAISANDSVVNSVVNTFVQQMCYDIKGLFKWGLKGMSLANEKDELLVFDFKETRYDKQTHILKGIGDVIVPGVTSIKNISVDSKLTLRTFSSGKREVRLELASPNLFIRDMRGSFYFSPKGNQPIGYLQFVTNIRFAWFFDLFITQSRYKKIMEWRLRQILKNIKEEANKR
ncbi:MAG: hypothetical protein ACOYM7_04410 [Paludibacter sp.]